jgi:hypothetical protein
MAEQKAMRPQEPLTREESEPLWRWERRITWLNVAAMGGLLLAGVAAHRFGDFAWLQRPFLGGAIVLIAAAAVLQFRERCPRCGARLRSKLLNLLPDKCASCGVDFPRPPRRDG